MKSKRLSLSFRLPRTVVILGFVSFFNDTASEMITPLLPVFLTLTLGAGPAVVGLVEGIAEATASLLKLLSGWLADRGWNRKNLVLGGYVMSNSARPLIGLVLGWGWVLLLRFLDRIGKGLRTAPRDALIAAAVARQVRGQAFGFQRALDHAGAMLGPLLAFVLLSSGMSMEQVFIASVAPGILVVLLLAFGLPSTRTEPKAVLSQPLRWRMLDTRLRALILASGGLALATVPEVFLILWAQDRGLQVLWIPLVWAAAHGVKTIVALPAGIMSDRLGRLPVVVIGWSLRIVLLLTLALVEGGSVTTWFLFLAYAGGLAFTEGAERALIGDLAPLQLRATVFGLYHLVCGIMVLPGAVLFGVIWQVVSPGAAFVTAAVLTSLAAAVLLWFANAKSGIIGKRE